MLQGQWYFGHEQKWAQNIKEITTDPQLGYSEATKKMVEEAFEERDSSAPLSYSLKFLKSNGPKNFSIVAYPNKIAENTPTFYLDETLIIWRSSVEGIGKQLNDQADIQIRDWKFVKEIQ